VFEQALGPGEPKARKTPGDARAALGRRVAVPVPPAPARERALFQSWTPPTSWRSVTDHLGVVASSNFRDVRPPIAPGHEPDTNPRVGAERLSRCFHQGLRVVRRVAGSTWPGSVGVPGAELRRLRDRQGWLAGERRAGGCTGGRRGRWAERGWSERRAGAYLREGEQTPLVGVIEKWPRCSRTPGKRVGCSSNRSRCRSEIRPLVALRHASSQLDVRAAPGGTRGVAGAAIARVWRA
jgi:hypothetical protein